MYVRVSKFTWQLWPNVGLVPKTQIQVIQDLLQYSYEPSSKLNNWITQ
jgi:hypothetical protein